MDRQSLMSNRRVLVIDDNLAIHQDFVKVLCAGPEDEEKAALDILESAILGEQHRTTQPTFEVASAHQGRAGRDHGGDGPA